MRRLAGIGRVLGVVAGLAAPAQTLELDWVLVDAVGNLDDNTKRNQCCSQEIGVGAVDYVYWISAFEITNAEYAEFLNAIAASDPGGVYNTRMETIHVVRSGSDGSYTYAPVAGREERPIGFIDFYDTLRFANWLENGQPVGPQAAGTTEDGTYTLLGANPDQVTRNPGSIFFLTSLDEWYKAAYYDPFLDAYWNYPTGTDVAPTPEPPPGNAPPSANFCPDREPPVANCVPFATNGPGDATNVGAYFDSPSPFGTFDQGGNVLEWNEEISFNGTSWLRGFRSGWYQRGPLDMASHIADEVDPNLQNLVGMGFRVATVPEPRRELLLVATGLTVLALRGRRRRLPSASDA